MERTVSVERLYSLGDFQNIKFTTTVAGVPDQLANNDNVTALLFLQGSSACDIAYMEYKKRREELKGEKAEEILAKLKQEREQTFTDLKAEIDSVYVASKKELIGTITKETTNE